MRETKYFINNQTTFKNVYEVDPAFHSSMNSFGILRSGIISYGTEMSVIRNGIVNPKGHRIDGSLLGNLRDSHHGFGPQRIFFRLIFLKVTIGKLRNRAPMAHELTTSDDKQIFLIKIIFGCKIMFSCVDIKYKTSKYK